MTCARISVARISSSDDESRRLEHREGSAGGVQEEVRAAGPIDERIDRRTLAKLLGATAAAVVGGSVLGESATSPAAASNGAPVDAGGETTAENRTSVRYDGASPFGGIVLLGNDSIYDGASANYPAALGGLAGAGATAGKGGVANGIYGFTDNGDGNGVVGYNSGFVAGSGAGVFGLAFAPNATGVKATNSEGTAISGTSDSTNDDVTAIIGTMSSTNPGSFSTAIRGVNNGTTGLGIGVWGSHAGGGWGMYATAVHGIGLNASGGSGIGVKSTGATGLSATGADVGVSASGPIAVQASGSGTKGIALTATADSSAPAAKITNTGRGQGLLANGKGSYAAVQADNSGSGAGLSAQSVGGRGAILSGKVAQLKLVPAVGSTHPSSGETGDLYVDKRGRLWFCKTGGAHARWTQVA